MGAKKSMSETLSKNMTLIGQNDLGGHGGVGEGMALQVTSKGKRVLWIAHEGPPKNFTGVDVTDPKNTKVICQTELPHSNMRSNSLEVTGDILAVAYQVYELGVEPAGIELFDVSDPENPTRVDKITIEYRDNTDTNAGTKAKAVALAQLPNKHYMTMVWDDNNFDFHYCESEDIKTGFHKPNRVMKDQIDDFAPGRDGNSGNGTYQSVNFVLDTDGTMYFVATRNSEKGSPTVPGRDYLDLYRVKWENGYAETPKISRIDHRQFFCYNQQCNFGAGTGIYIDDDDHMYLYGTPHWLHDGNKRYNFNEYSYV